MALGMEGKEEVALEVRLGAWDRMQEAPALRGLCSRSVSHLFGTMTF